MTTAKLILIWGIENLITSYLKELLSVKEDWRILHISTRKELHASLQDPQNTGLETVLIGQGYQNGLSNLPVQVIQRYPAIRLIVVYLDCNKLEVDRQQQIAITRPSDLLTVIENQPPAFIEPAPQSS